MKYSKKAKAIILACVIVILIAGIRLGSDIRYLQSWLVFGLPCAGLLIYSIAAARAYKARMLWTVCSVLALAATYLLWTNVSLSDAMVNEWTMRNMFLWAAFAVVTGAFFAKYIFAVSAFASFNIGTAAGDLFGVYSFDPGGGRLHSGWFIFCCIFFCTMLAAAIAQAVYGRVKKARAKKEG